MTLQKVIDIFLALKKNSGLTYATQSRILRCFGKRHVGKDISEITQDDVRAYVMSREQTCKRNYFQQLRLFFNWAIQANYLDKSPVWEKMKYPPQQKPYIYSKDEIRRLLIAASKKTDCRSNFQHEMFRAILLTTYACGLRIGEATRLKCSDVDFERNTLIIIDSKFHRSRFATFRDDFACILKKYYSQRIKRVPMPEGINSALFPSRTGHKVAIERIEKIFKKIREEVGIPCTGKFGPRIHDLRHTFAVNAMTDAYKRGENAPEFLYRLSVYLGHSSINGTRRYLTLTPELRSAGYKLYENYQNKSED